MSGVLTLILSLIISKRYLLEKKESPAWLVTLPMSDYDCSIFLISRNMCAF